MLAIQIERTGGPEVLEPKTLPDPAPGPGQILVRHGAIGLNFVETYHRSGHYPLQLPKVLGQEAAGTVDVPRPHVEALLALADELGVEVPSTLEILPRD